MKKRVVSWFLTIVICLSFLPVVPVAAANMPEISVGSATADISGGAVEVTLPIVITDNPGFSSMELFVEVPDGWNITAIACGVKSLTEYTIFCDVMDLGGMQIPQQVVVPQVNPDNGAIIVAHSVDITKSGYIGWVTCSVPEGILNEEYSVSVRANFIARAENTKEDISDSFKIKPGAITVSGGLDKDDPKCTITVEAAVNGIVTVDKTSGKAGETVTVTATPAAYYELVEILVDGVAIEGNMFTISGNHSVSAVFRATVRAEVKMSITGTDSIALDISISKAGKAAVAFYDTDGRMLGVRLLDVPVGESKHTLTQLTADPSKTECKIIFLDGDSKPMCKVIEP